MAEWTEGVCGDGAAILRDGVLVPVHEVVEWLDQIELTLRALCVAVREQDDVLDETPSLRRALLDAESWITK